MREEGRHVREREGDMRERRGEGDMRVRRHVRERRETCEGDMLERGRETCERGRETCEGGRRQAKKIGRIGWAYPTCRVPSLYHKLLDNTMEDVSIVICILRMNTEVFNSLGTAKNKKVKAGTQGSKHIYVTWLTIQERV